MSYRDQLSIKRAMDLALCGVFALCVAPLIPLIALVVKLDSPGPLLFRQTRIGLAERPFDLLKFRTMRVSDAGQSLDWCSTDEARITRSGRLLRDYGLDEIPQLVSILRGDMSIVGPRPPLPAQARAFSPAERLMFLMKPGVLSLAAVEGRRSITPEERRGLHVQYVRRWSVWLDFRIMVRCAIVVVFCRNAAESMNNVAQP